MGGFSWILAIPRWRPVLHLILLFLKLFEFLLVLPQFIILLLNPPRVTLHWVRSLKLTAENLKLLRYMNLFILLRWNKLCFGRDPWLLLYWQLFFVILPWVRVGQRVFCYSNAWFLLLSSLSHWLFWRQLSVGYWLFFCHWSLQFFCLLITELERFILYFGCVYQRCVELWYLFSHTLTAFAPVLGIVQAFQMLLTILFDWWAQSWNFPRALQRNWISIIVINIWFEIQFKLPTI